MEMCELMQLDSGLLKPELEYIISNASWEYSYHISDAGQILEYVRKDLIIAFVAGYGLLNIEIEIPYV